MWKSPHAPHTWLRWHTDWNGTRQALQKNVHFFSFFLSFILCSFWFSALVVKGGGKGWHQDRMESKRMGQVGWGGQSDAQGKMKTQVCWDKFDPLRTDNKCLFIHVTKVLCCMISFFFFLLGDYVWYQHLSFAADNSNKQSEQRELLASDQ